MEIVTSGTGAGSGALDLPFQRRNVEEWSRMDRVTGILEHARVETDHWAANTSHSSHKYGKVVDSRARNLADGSVQQRQRKQLEVFQAQVPGGSLQVIRTQSVTTSTTHNDFENLQLALNPLDLSSQKTKASVGRSGSIGGRRPPSRPRSLIGKVESSITEEDKDEVDLRLSEVARICQQVHEKAKKELVSPSFHRNEDTKSDSRSNDDIQRIATEKVKEYEHLPSDKSCDQSTVQKKSGKISNGYFHVNISRKKSCSTEDLQENDDETDDEVWKRTSKVRRSLQFPASKNINFDVIPTGNVSKLRKELEEGKHFHATRDISTIDIPDNTMNEGASFKDKSRENEGHPKETGNTAVGGSSNKRHSFVTVESLKEVRGRLRRLNSSPVCIESSVNESKIEDIDDGIVSEEFNSHSSKMRPYMYGADTVASQKFLGLGTGSLESRISSRVTNAASNRSEEWYNRRKSYGFEPVHQEVNSDSLDKTNGESSTDSGICRSSETFGSSSWSRLLHKDNKLFDSHLNTSHTIHIKNSDPVGTKMSAKLRGTVVTLGSSSESSPQPEESKPHEENSHLIVNDYALSKKSSLPSEPTTITIPILPESDNKNFHAAPKSLAERRELLLKHSLWMNSAEVKRHSIAVDETKYVRREVKQHSNNMNEPRRHSYLENHNGAQYHHSLPGTVNSKHDDLLEKKDQAVTIPGASHSTVVLGESEENSGKRHKRVEFCKTEVHFAAEPGRFNIVETDEKPPPTNMFRRRRKTNTTPQVQTGLPEIRFGDSVYEKKLLSGTETSVHQIEINLNSPKICTAEIKESENVLPVTHEVFQDDADREDIVSTQANATIFASSENKDINESEVINEPDIQSYLLKDQSTIKPRSILKNNRKLRQFHLGELEHADVEESESKWGVRLKPVESSNTSPTMWRSSVALHSSGNVSSEEKSFSSETELQKLLRSLKPATERTDHHKTVAGVEVKVITGGTAWSVANRVKQAEDQKYAENKGYSTRINFGAGETKVVTKEQQLRQETKHLSSPMYQQSDSLKPIWLRREERKQLDVKTSSDKAYIVHIGEKENQSSQNSTSPKKTTMITIDLSPTCSNAEDSTLLQTGIQEDEKKIQNNSGSLLSPLLIMKTIHSPKRAQQATEPKTENAYGSIKKKTIQKSEGKLDVQNVWNKPESPDRVGKGQAVTSQLAALRELYYNMELSDDSEKADEEVSSYMNIPDKHEKTCEGNEKENEDNSSVVSGSWSRMRAFRNISRFSNKKETSDNVANAEPNIKTTATAKLDSYGNSGRLQAVETLVSTRSGHPKITSISLHYEGDSPTKHEAMNGYADKQLHSEEAKSPSLFEKRTYENIKPKFSTETKINEEPLSSYRKMKPLEQNYSLKKPECEEPCIAVHRPHITTDNVPYQQKPVVNSNTYTKSNNKRLSLQNQTVPPSEVSSEHSPHKSRLDYKEERKSERFNPVTEKNIFNKAPDSSRNRNVSLERLLKENSLEEQTTKNYNFHGKEKMVYRRKERSVSPSKRSSPHTSTTSESKSASSEMPIYQNLDVFAKRGVQRSDTESTIIEELTRAADEILQAVNGFTDEDSYKASTSDNDDEGRFQKGRKTNTANLGTISEMPQQSSRRTVKKQNNTAKVQQVLIKRQVKQASSNSSIESLTKRLQEPSKKKGTNGLGNRTSNRTARLLQRASSRELLLHASSSEDVASGAESRKPRLTRRSKTSANKTDATSATKMLKKSSTAQQKDSTDKTHGMRRKELIDVNKPKERLPGSANKHSSSAWKSSNTVTATSSRIINIKDEDRHRKDTSKLSTKTRSPRHKAEGPSRAPRTESREKSSEHHRVRNGGHSLSSACVVTKKKPNLVASHKEGDIQAVSKK